ncbi:hypothetical protein PCYB_145420 [Plasmodium cynomolgi strain B]|uniref:RNA-binding S4 domain-containing protein n=1 Tax=Plasmodium cynomolgi (strain B) TaxID=1120755 RepID=K6UYX7_PLACD|nr:hypothetical protein PCYB_145420 [Plasmodium cynomolgi strain B]GAB69114.1 hypothetical protein PCYB_145420 [Plasmodium cynomolgi strain B]
MFPSVQLKRSTLLRLSKILSLSSVTSRGKAQELIKNGKVKVNNQVVRQNVVVDINSAIELEGKPILVDVTTKLWGIYKPKHVFCSSERNYEYEERRDVEKRDVQMRVVEKRDVQMRDVQMRDVQMRDVEKRDGEMKDWEMRAGEMKDHSHRLVTARGSPQKGSYSTTQLASGDLRKEFPLEGRKQIGRGGRRSDLYQGHAGEVAERFRQLSWKGDIVRHRSEVGKKQDEVGKQDEVERPARSEPQRLNTNLFDFIRKKNKAYETKNKVSNDIPEHLIVVNSLSASSEGLVLLTNDGDFARNLKDTENNIVTTYIVKVKEELTNEKIKLIEKGCHVGDLHIRPLSVHVIKPHSTSPKWIKITLVEKSHTHLDLLFSKYSLTIRKCKRFSFGPYKASDLLEHFLTPLKIHSTLSAMVPKYSTKLILAQPTGNVLTDEHDKLVLVKDYLKNSAIRG